MAPRCRVCRMVHAFCICAELPSLTLRTHLSLIMHHREWPKTTNTGHLALKSLTRSSLFIWGEEGGEAPSLDALVPAGHQGYVLAPSGSPLTDDLVATLRKGPPVALIVPDGNWRQATKMTWRIPAIADLPRLALPSGPPSAYQLRTEPRADGLATFEAIARALGRLEGAHVEAALERPFLAMVRGTLETRGQRPTS
jgi:DTW domain-containing protein YfiP